MAEQYSNDGKSIRILLSHDDLSIQNTAQPRALGKSSGKNIRILLSQYVHEK